MLFIILTHICLAFVAKVESIFYWIMVFIPFFLGLLLIPFIFALWCDALWWTLLCKIGILSKLLSWIRLSLRIPLWIHLRLSKTWLHHRLSITWYLLLAISHLNWRLAIVLLHLWLSISWLHRWLSIICHLLLSISRLHWSLPIVWLHLWLPISRLHRLLSVPWISLRLVIVGLHIS